MVKKQRNKLKNLTHAQKDKMLNGRENTIAVLILLLLVAVFSAFSSYDKYDRCSKNTLECHSSQEVQNAFIFGKKSVETCNLDKVNARIEESFIMGVEYGKASMTCDFTELDNKVGYVK